MNVRQRDIIEILLKRENSRYLPIKEIADSLHCSEKTIRNEFKQMDQWLKEEFEAEIVRKPNVGVRLYISEAEKNKLMAYLQKRTSSRTVRINDQERKEGILIRMIDNQILSLQQLSEEFYVTRGIIKQDLQEIESWLEGFKLSVDSRQRAGITLKGDEKNKRTAFLRIHEFGKGGHLPFTHFYEKVFSGYDITKTKEQIKRMEQSLGKSFTKEARDNVVLHVLMTIKRLRKKQEVRLSVKDVERLKEKKEYLAVKEMLVELEKVFLVRFPEEEGLYLLLHVLSAKERNDTSAKNGELSPNLQVFLKTVIREMTKRTNIGYEEDAELFRSLETHMKLVFDRLEHELYHKNPLLSDIKKTYSYTFTTLFHAVKELEEEVGFVFSEDEIAYLAIHFEVSKERLKKANGEHKRVIVVCSMGVGMSQLLVTKLERKFHSLDVLRAVSHEDLEDAIEQEKPDFIISTIALECQKIPMVTVSPLLPPEEEEKVKRFIAQLGKKEGHSFDTLKSLLKEELVMAGVKESSPDDLISALCLLLKEAGYTDDAYEEGVKEREKMAPTAIGGGIAIPHGHPKHVLKQGVAMAVLQEPILWKREWVSVVLLLAIKETNTEEIKRLFEEITFLGETPEKVNEWRHITDHQTLFQVI